MTERLYTAAEVAWLFGCSLQTVYNCLRSDEPFALKVRTNWKDRKSDIEEYTLRGVSRDGSRQLRAISLDGNSDE